MPRYKERLNDWEIKSLKEKVKLISFKSKAGSLSLILLVVIIISLSLISPYLPPRYGWGNWSPPNDLDEYFSQAQTIWIVIPSILLIGYTIHTIRTKIDFFLAYKWISNYRITEVISFGVIKILLLDKWHLFVIRANQQHFDSVEQGQFITIRKTGTLRTIDFLITEESQAKQKKPTTNIV
ncbi:hypothetical protein [Pontibacter burrus]|uniref:Uncharacterized protein n=1 Tax=Pontibacter burrus TaxID=2704466 RepID=A0A6B3LRE1_9BACT|nr:hypothetical protein [Pontibacter burrus]NEM96061.1 hypothetical protein [Pontibacter burrus]